MDKSTFEVLENYMHTFTGDSAHDTEHIYRVLNNALVIAAEEKDVDYDVLISACLLHDIGRPDQIANPKLCHAAVGSERAYQFLLDSGFSPAVATHVRDCIRTHRFRKNDPPQSLEAKILFDADKLDVVGAIGIARTLVYRGTVEEPLYHRLRDGSISNGETDETHSFFKEYHFKLKKLYDRFYTKKGKTLAQSRRTAAENFYNSLYSEVSQLDQAGKQHLDNLLK